MTLILPITGHPDDHFACLTCGRGKHNRQKARQIGNAWQCKACEKSETMRNDPNKNHYTNRNGNPTWKSSAEGAKKKAATAYKKGKLPKWMFS